MNKLVYEAIQPELSLWYTRFQYCPSWLLPHENLKKPSSLPHPALLPIFLLSVPASLNHTSEHDSAVSYKRSLSLSLLRFYCKSTPLQTLLSPQITMPSANIIDPRKLFLPYCCSLIVTNFPNIASTTVPHGFISFKFSWCNVILALVALAYQTSLEQLQINFCVKNFVVYKTTK